LAEADHAGDFQQGAMRIGNEVDRAARKLETEVVNERRTANGLPSGGKGLVLIAAAAAGGLLAEIVAAEYFACDSGAGDRVSRHEFLCGADAVGELEGGLSGSRFGGE